MEKTLKEHLRFERLISEMSARFVNISPDQVDREIERGLKVILEFFQVDRCGLLLTSQDITTWQVTHAAFADGIATVPVHTDLPVALFPWVYKKVVEQRGVSAFSSLEELPAEAHIDKQTYSEWGIRSSVTLPISTNLNDHYLFSLDAMRSARVWPGEYIPRLRLLAEIFINALQHADTRLQLEEQMKSVRFHSALSARFVNAPSEHLDETIEISLQSIAEFFEVDRIILCQLSDDKSQMIVTNSWAAPGFEPKAGVIMSTEVPWIFQKIMRGETVVCSCLDDLPVEAVRDKKYLSEAGSRSNILIPLLSGGKVLGFVGLGSLSRQRNWPDKMVRGLQPMTQILSSTLTRKRAFQALRESEERLNLAAASANAGLWIVNFTAGHVWVTEKTRELFGFAPDLDITFDFFLTVVHPEDRERVRQIVRQAIDSKKRSASNTGLCSLTAASAG